ncbi:hypothetical protein ISTM_317 [Insectomime virus]|uniref:F-box domain-containing protein n=1 Tax=Tunisvirus fontaine2 TaxID=1421067 RepID=V9SEP5_9VIRU|nr:hypothetical protein D1R32_gp483 [Tunisvirus fontaine2]AHA46215.1 hypothetical protein ISTM_317 [Insectomime virus]AHC55200.1 hypothetical protein TNS_ORF482 [Tunisvirus fontaine2]
MDSLANETLVHILGFLDAKDALMFAMTCSHNLFLVLKNPKVIQKRVTHKEDEFVDETMQTIVYGETKVSKTMYKEMLMRNAFESGFKKEFRIKYRTQGTLFKRKRIGIWKRQERDWEVGVPETRMNSAWTNGRLDYVCTIGAKDRILFPRECKKGEEEFVIEGKKLACVFTRNPWKTRECRGEKWFLFENKQGGKYSYCCKEHRGELPPSLFLK